MAESEEVAARLGKMKRRCRCWHVAKAVVVDLDLELSWVVVGNGADDSGGVRQRTRRRGGARGRPTARW